MDSTLRDETRARRFLLDVEATRRILFAVAGSQSMGAGGKAALLNLERVANDVGLPQEQFSVVQAIRDTLAHGGHPSAGQLAEAGALVEVLKDALTKYVSAHSTLEGPVPTQDRNRFLLAARLVDAELGPRLARDRAAHVKTVEQEIFRQPGHFIHDLYEKLNDPIPRPGFSYTSVWLYVQQLVRSHRVLTMGGMKGFNRYCFPHPNALQDWAPYYGRPFAIEAKIGERLTGWFDFTHCPKLVDVFKANSILRQDVLVVTEMGRLANAEGTVIRSFGTLQSAGHALSSLGLKTTRSLPAASALIASGVDRILVDGREERLWTSQDAASVLA